MRRLISVIVVLIATSVGVAFAAAGDKPQVVQRFCVGVEVTPHHYFTNGDLNIVHGEDRICIVGKRGPAGPEGEMGRPGEDGLAGQDGENGEAGQDGADGADGERGEPGKDGQDGQDGVDGQDGADGTVTNLGPEVCVTGNAGALKLCSEPGEGTFVGYLVLAP